jgi:Zn-dependent protease
MAEDPNSPFRSAMSPTPLRESGPTFGQRMKKLFAPLGAVLVVIGKFFAQLKFFILPFLKFLPVLLKTGGTMILSIGIYALTWGWRFALGFVLLIFVHECGHLIVAKRFGLKVSAPMFIPFMGAFIALKDQPQNAWMEAWVGIGGPIFGALGAWACDGLYFATGNPIFRGLAYSGFFLNLFNLAPIGFLDGGRIVTALSPWLWLVGLVVVGVMVFTHPNFILVLILLMSLPRIWSLFRRKTDAEKRYFEVTPWQRGTMAVLYFGLIAVLVVGMRATHIVPQNNRQLAPVQVSALGAPAR